MQKNLLKLALTGLVAGACLSSCSKTPSEPSKLQDGSQHMQKKERMGPHEGPEDLSSPANPNPASCANSCGGQGDQSTYNEQISGKKLMKSKRLSAAKPVMQKENICQLDK